MAIRPFLKIIFPLATFFVLHFESTSCKSESAIDTIDLMNAINLSIFLKVGFLIELIAVRFFDEIRFYIFAQEANGVITKLDYPESKAKVYISLSRQGKYTPYHTI